MSHRRAIIMSLQTAMRLIERRARKQPKAEHVTYAYSKDEDQERSSYIRIEPIGKVTFRLTSSLRTPVVIVRYDLRT